MRTIKTARKQVIAILWLLMLAVMLASLPVAASDITSRSIGYVDEGDSLSFTLWYDKEFPNAVLISPSNERYPISEDSGYMTAVIKDTYTAVTVKDAKEGRWTVEYDRSLNDSFEVKVMGSVKNITVDETVTAYDQTANRLTVTFKVSFGDERTYYSYIVSLTDANDYSSHIRLANSSAYTGDDVSLTFDMSDYSIGEYCLYIQANMRYDSTTLTGIAYTEPFTHTATDYFDAPTGVSLTADTENRNVTVDWSRSDAGYNYEFVLDIYDEDANIISHTFFKSDADMTTVVIPEGHDKVTVELCYKNGELLSKPFSRTVNFANPVSTEDVFYTAAETAAGDNSSPSLYFNENYNGMTLTSGEITISGNAGDAVSLTVNKAEVQLSENGEFAVPLTLKPGDNLVTVEAFDVSGNITSATLKLTVAEAVGQNTEEDEANSESEADCENKTLPFWIPLAVGAVAAIAVIVTAIVLAAKKDKLKAFSVVPFVVLFSVTTVISGAILVYHIVIKSIKNAFASSADYIELAERSLEEAAQYLTDIDRLNEVLIPRFTYFTLGSAAALAVAIIALIIVNAIRKKRGDKSSQAAPKAKKEKTHKPAKVPKAKKVKSPKEVTVQPHTQVPVQPQAQTLVQPQVTRVAPPTPLAPPTAVNPVTPPATTQALQTTDNNSQA